MIRLLGEKFEISPWIMNRASNTSGTTNTTITLLDTSSASFSMGGCSSIHSNGGISSSDQADQHISPLPITNASPQISNKIFNYKDNTDTDFGNSLKCEDICVSMCRQLNILPTTRLLFGLRVMDSENEWVAPGKELTPGVRYCFRLRIKIPNMDTELKTLDKQAFEYLYWQIRYDILHEKIPEIRHKEKKANIMGLAVMDMSIDLQAKSTETERNDRKYKRDIVANIENKYKQYLPQTLLKEHRYFVKPKIRQTFKEVREKTNFTTEFKLYYIEEVCKLAPKYLMEVYCVTVDYIPNDDLNTLHPTASCNASNGNTKMRAYVKLDNHDDPEPGLKISLKKEKWTLLTKIRDIIAISIEDNAADLEITDVPQSYCMRFDSKVELESFITYIGAYLRLTSKWLYDLCDGYTTPSLNNLIDLRCHGPIGGAFSFAKLRSMSKVGKNCIIRQCEKEYDVFYIDINTQTLPLGKLGENITTTKISLKNKKWLLHTNNNLREFKTLKDLKNSISPQMFWIPPTENDYAPLLLICLPKKLLPKKADIELSESELQKSRVQVLIWKRDLLIYEGNCESNDDMWIMKGEWIQKDSCKNVTVKLRVLKEGVLEDIIDLSNECAKFSSSHFIKLYGLTLKYPYTMVMEYTAYGPLDKFLCKHKDKISFKMRLWIMYGLVKGMAYLVQEGLYHGFIRCSNMYVTKFDARSDTFEVKIGDPGFRRSYSNKDLPWIPQEFYNNPKDVRGKNFADKWAFATALWEIFSDGKSPLEELNCNGNESKIAEKLNMNRTRGDGGILPKPKNCLDEIYQIMLDGWQSEENKQFNSTRIFSIIKKLNGIKENKLSKDLDDISFECNEDNGNSSNNYEQSLVELFRCMGQVLPFPEGKLMVYELLDEGHFAYVHKGIIEYDDPDKPQEKVAVKKMKTNKNGSTSNDFQREAKIMQALEHENIVKIIFQSTQRPYYIVMELVSGGSLKDYLRGNQPNLTNKRLLHFAHDIAKGMKYLAEKKIIHRDLAARNVLIENDRAKVSDFGLAQYADSEGCYIGKSVRDIPINWYAPESIRDNTYSYKSDVWSFGVTMHEIMSRGGNPYLGGQPGLKGEEIMNRLYNGERLPKPELCPQIIYETLILPCWELEPEKRPDFGVILESIQNLIEKDDETI
ncbi:tyrosine-protein kinase hopscotch [Zeugodacus cucurbitae]|uniref:Tyrosine-protein kinase hopscotch n=1 Tax=Zeugodacus cucurbitae TaxID=28588 RepID=A0A0A1WKZ2_ZEUCU|nr:tyrosine-protein kinase hopscotch [Zeugodacus cucurbitae]